MKLLKNIFSKPSPPLTIKVTDESNLNLGKTLENLLIEFDTTKNRQKLKDKNVEIIIAKDFGKSVYENSCLELKEHIDNYGYPTGDVNGHFCTPLDKDSVFFKIILNPNIFEDVLYFGTIFHEFTHVIDFTDYINHYGNPDFMKDSIKKHNYYYEFYLWTEFNAKRIGMRRLMVEYKKNEWNVAFPQTTSLFKKDIISEKRQLRRLYYLVHFLARISECATKSLKADPDVYPVSFLQTYFGKDVIELHRILEKTKNFKDFESRKKKLRKLIDL